MPSPAAAAVPAATVFAFPDGIAAAPTALAALAMVLVPAILMVSTIRFRSFKTIDLQVRRPVRMLFLIAGGLVLVAINPRAVLMLMAYAYLASAFIGLVVTRIRQRGKQPASGDQPEEPARDTAFS
jgi:CDP-diacylglycerol--serine O-phosphatidyltransferase